MKSKLSKLAKDKGFGSLIVGSDPWQHVDKTKEDVRYLLYMTEIQKWLIEKYKMYILVDFVLTNLNKLEWIPNVYSLTDGTPLYPTDNIECSTYEDALEAGLIEGLKLLV